MTNASNAQRVPLWKRLGRRGSKSHPPPTAPGAAIPLKKDEEADGKKKGLIRKLKSSFRKNGSNNDGDDDAELVMMGEQQRMDGSAGYAEGSFGTVEVGSISLVRDGTGIETVCHAISRNTKLKSF